MFAEVAVVYTRVHNWIYSEHMSLALLLAAQVVVH